jgi:serine/threonine protein kinase
MVDGKPITPAHDYWCLGVLMYEMLTGSTPFHSNTDELSMKFIKELPVHYSQNTYSRISDDTKDLVRVNIKIILKNVYMNF